MGWIGKSLGSIRSAVLWLQWTILTRRQVEGPMWITGRPTRERALIRRLLAEYPGLANQPRESLHAITEHAVRSLGHWQPQIVMIGAMAVTALFASMTWSFLYGIGAPLPRWTRLAGTSAAAIVVGEAVRRWYIRGEMDRAVAAVHPTLFCACGYCLLGLPVDATVCPECGAARPVVTSPASSSPRASA